MAEKLLKEHLYGDLLAPEPGYTTDFAVGMTYSLGFDALLTAYLAFGMLDDVNDEALSKQHLLLEAISRSSDKVVVFCNKGGIAVPAKIQKVHSLLEGNILEVFDRNNIHANFHPKLWLIREVSKEDSSDARIKLIVTSRNLKFTETLDCIACLKGKVGPRTHKNPKHETLADFVMNVAACTAITDPVRKSIKKLTEDLMRVEKFDVSAPFEDYDFFTYFFQGPLDKPLIPAELMGKQNVLVSPFIEKNTLAGLRPKYSTLVTRREYVTEEIMKMFDGKVYVCNDEMAAKGMDLHAKMYHLWSGRDSQYLLLGSANATYSAFNRNAEILLRLKYKHGNIAGFLSEFYSDTDKDSRFIRMTELDITPQESDSTVDDTQKMMKELMCSDRLEAKITHHHDGNYSITVTTDRCDGSILLAPLQKSGAATPWAKKMVFGGLDAAELSEFYIISATAADGSSLEKIIKIPTSGIPKEREGAIYKSIIRSSSDFFAFLELMLTDNPLSCITGGKAEIMSWQEGSEQNAKTLYAGLYESLLKAAATEPEKIKKIQNLTGRLDSDVVPEEFRMLIKRFAAAIK